MAFQRMGEKMIKLTHYLYILSSWSLAAEKAVDEVRRMFGDRLNYDWRIAVTDYDGTGQLTRDELEFFYARLEAITGEPMNLGWWYDGYNWLVPDRTAAAARLLGAGGSEVRLALAEAGLRRGERITDVNVALQLASQASGLSVESLATQFDRPETALLLAQWSREFETSGVKLRPAFQLQNDIGDMVVLSGIWTREPLQTAIEALLADEESYAGFSKNIGA